MAVPELDELAKVLPERDPDGCFFWQSFVDRIEKHLDGLPAPDGGDSFVGGCVAAGCQAVPVIRRNTLWEGQAPPLSDRRARGIFELRIRLGLFFAASLRYLVHGACRLRAKVGDAEWHAVTEQEVSFRDFLAAHDGELDVAWSKALPDFGAVCLLTQFFFTSQGVLLLTPELAGDVLAFVQPGRPRGLFGRMLAAEGQVENESLDVAAVFLEGLAEAVDQQFLRVNTRRGGHLFVTPAFWLLTTPIGLDCVTELIRTRAQGRRHDFTRHDVFGALRASGCLVGGETCDSDTPLCVLSSGAGPGTIELHGLCIASAALPWKPAVSDFDGIVILKKENVDGNDDQG